MKKKLIRLTESDLHNIIHSVIKQNINEGATADSGLIEKWNQCIDMLGSEHMLSWLWDYLSSDQIHDCLKWIDRYEELGLFNDDMEDESGEMDESTKRGKLSTIIAESLHKVLHEDVEDDFTPHGYKTTSNSGGRMIQLSDDGSSARIKYEDGSVSDWLEIEHRNPNEDEDWYDEEDTVPYVQDGEYEEKIDDYMRY